VTITAQSTIQLVASPKDAAGNPLPGSPVSWSSHASAVAAVSPAGLVTGVAPGTALVEATSGAVKGQATITVLPNPGSGATLRSGTVSLPPGSQLSPASLQVRNGFGAVPITPTGAFSHLVLSGGPHLAGVYATDQRPILLGWLDAQQAALSARSTAEVLAYFDMGAHFLPMAGRDFIRRELATRSELGSLVSAITTALVGNPATATLDVPGVQQARRAVQTQLLPTAQAAALRAAGGVRPAVQFDPLGAKSGVVPYETDLNQVTIRNQYRRRVMALVDRVSYVDANGQTHTDKARVARQEIPAVFGVTTFGGLLSDVVLGNLAWAEVVSEPIATPVHPVDARSTRYRLMVLGTGDAPASQRNQLTAAEQQELQLVTAKAFFIDLMLPVLTNMVLEGDVAGDAIDAALKSSSASNVLSDVLNLLFTTVPTAWDKSYAGDLRGAMEEVWLAVLGSDELQARIFELMALVALAVLPDPASATGLIDVSDFGKQLLKFVGKVNLVLTASDAALQAIHSGLSNGIETWNLTVLPAKVALNPPTTIMGPLDIQLLTAVVLGLEDLAPGAILQYKWTTTGQHGTLTDANNEGATQITGSHRAVTYVPTRQSSGTDQVTVEVTRVQAGTQPLVVGTATASLTVRNPAISLTPEDVSLREGEHQVFTVDVPAALSAGVTLRFRWSTTGDYGSLDRGMRSFETSSPQATYTARSTTRGEDDVAVEVLATANGLTASLGSDRARVRIERGPFTITPAATTTDANLPVQFMARPHGDVPPNPRYVWTFGDNTAPLVRLGDSLATHSYAADGSYRVAVELQDASGRRLAVAAATVQVGDPDPPPVWRITRLELTSLTGAVPHDSMMAHPNVLPYGQYYRTRAQLAAISAGASIAHVHALDGFTALPDCFDFNFNGNRQEELIWPAWIWIQFSNDVPNWCGEDRVVGHYPGDESWNGNSIVMGLHLEDYFDFQIPGWLPFGFDYPDPDFASVPGSLQAGSLAGRYYATWAGSSGPMTQPAPVLVVHEVTAQLSGTMLSGQLRFIYRELDWDGKPTKTWTATYSFEARRGR